MHVVSEIFVRHSHEFFYVSGDGQSLEGIVTMTDLLRAHASGMPPEARVTQFMAKNPMRLAADDTCATAAGALREYRLKTLPIVERKGSRQLAGCFRARRLMAYVLKEMQPQEKPARASEQRP